MIHLCIENDTSCIIFETRCTTNRLKPTLFNKVPAMGFMLTRSEHICSALENVVFNRMNIMFFVKVAPAVQPLHSKFAISYCMSKRKSRLKPAFIALKAIL